MTANLVNVLQRLDQNCSSILPYDEEDQSQPYVTSDGTCYGVSDVKDTFCESSKSSVRRLCRCEKPGECQTTALRINEASKSNA